MIPLLTDIFRKKGLKKFASRIRTGMIPLSGIHSVTVLLDSQDADVVRCTAAVQDFFKKAGIRPDIHYIDLRNRRRKKKEGDLTDAASTFTRKDLNWYGRLKNETASSFLKEERDLYIDLTARNDYPLQFMAAAFPARFKIGCTESGKSPFNIAVTPPSGGQTPTYEIFKEISALLGTIR